MVIQNYLLLKIRVKWAKCIFRSKSRCFLICKMLELY